MRSSLFLLVLAAAACGNDTKPPAVDAPMSTIDAPMTVDAAVDAPTVTTINGCTPAMAVDRTAAGASRTVAFFDDEYAPPCIRIQVGQSITWQGTFNDHPLEPGIIAGSSITLQPGSPVPSVSSGVTRTVAFTAAGEWAYYCSDHTPAMAGVIYVVP